MKWKHVILIGVLLLGAIAGLIYVKQEQVISLFSNPRFLGNIILGQGEVLTNSSNGSYEIIGNSVITNDSFVSINITPHTLIGDGPIIIKLISKQFTGDIDLAFATDTTKVKPRQALYYKPTNITTEKSHTCDFQAINNNDSIRTYNFSASSFNFTSNPNYSWCFRNETIAHLNGTIIRDGQVILFEHYFDRGNLTSKTIYWNETKLVEWQDISNIPNSADINFRGMNKVWYIKNFPVTAGQEYLLQIKMSTPIGFNESGKYFFGMKRSQDTIAQAIASQTLYYIDPWYNSSWGYRKNITFDGNKIGEDNLTDFPVLINITDANLSQYAQADGDDILFTQSDGSTKLDHEIEFYNSTTGWLVAWVRIPTLRNQTTNTSIFMYYNNSAASNQQNKAGVWSNGYLAVWHLGETATDGGNVTGLYKDSTSNSYNASQNGTNNQTGQIGSGQFFNNNSFDYINSNVDDPFDFENTTNFSISLWMNTATDPNTLYTALIGKGYVFAERHVIIRIDDFANDILSFRVGDTGSAKDCTTAFSTDIITGTWHHIVAVANRTGNLTGYVDGSLICTAGASNINLTNAETLKIGTASQAGYDNLVYYNGTIDEIRVSNVTRSSGWISTEFNNQNSSSTFYTLGAGETNPATAPQWSSNSTNSTLAGSSVLHNVYWTDDVALSGYIFSFDNGTGTLSNDTWVAFTGTTNWSNVTKVVNTTVGSTIRWRVYANDSSNNLNSTDIFTYNTTAPDTTNPVAEFGTNPADNANRSNTSVTFDLRGYDNAL
ncbi:MAG: LamG domain-containing protein, partial [Nanoarchaeota archaeon]